MLFPSILCGRPPAQPDHAQASSSSQAGAPRSPVRGQPGASSSGERSALAVIARSGRNRALFSIPGMRHLARGNWHANHPLQAGDLEQFEETMQVFIDRLQTAESPQDRAFAGLNMLRRLKNILRPFEGRLDQLEPTAKRQLLKGVHMTRMQLVSLSHDNGTPISSPGNGGRPGSADKADGYIRKVLKELKRVQEEVVKSADFALLLQAFQDTAEEAPGSPVNRSEATRNWVQDLETLIPFQQDNEGTLDNIAQSQRYSGVDSAREGSAYLSPISERGETDEDNDLSGARLEPGAVLGSSSRTQSSRLFGIDLDIGSLIPEGDETAGNTGLSGVRLDEPDAVLGSSNRTQSSLFEIPGLVSGRTSMEAFLARISTDTAASLTSVDEDNPLPPFTIPR